MASNFLAVTESVTIAAETFVNEFYSMFDSDRSSLVSVFRTHSNFIWDGNEIQMTLLPNFLTQTPPTKHKVLSFDAHPVLLSSDTQQLSYPTETILITAQGDMSYGLSEFQRGFQHTFILKQDLSLGPDSRVYYCASFNVRLTKDTLALQIEKPQYQNPQHKPHPSR
jgi:hypothetical protein